jgi:hypothetical protein
MLDVDFDVLDPPELRDDLAALGARYARAAVPPQGGGEAAGSGANQTIRPLRGAEARRTEGTPG